MKKFIAIIAMVICLASCGPRATKVSTDTVDSTNVEVVVDSVNVAVDTVVAE